MGLVDLDEQLPFDFSAMVTVKGELTSQNLEPCIGDGHVEFIGGGLLTPIGIASLAVFAGGLVGLLFNARPAKNVGSSDDGRDRHRAPPVPGNRRGVGCSGPGLAFVLVFSTLMEFGSDGDRRRGSDRRRVGVLWGLFGPAWHPEAPPPEPNPPSNQRALVHVNRHDHSSTMKAVTIPNIPSAPRRG